MPDGVYRFANEPHDARLAALAFALGSYRFTRYRKAEKRQVELDLPQSIDRDDLDHVVEGVTLARDLINTPANDMGPAELEKAARGLPRRHERRYSRRRRRDVLTKDYPLVHAAAAARPHGRRRE